VEDVFSPPWHPYTEALLSAAPVPDPDHDGPRILLEGNLPSVMDLPPGCPFSSRCPRSLGTLCEGTPPPQLDLGGGHRIACHIPPADLRELAAGENTLPMADR